jgi:hypothetical protein
MQELHSSQMTSWEWRWRPTCWWSDGTFRKKRFLTKCMRKLSVRLKWRGIYVELRTEDEGEIRDFQCENAKSFFKKYVQWMKSTIYPNKSGLPFRLRSYIWKLRVGLEHFIIFFYHLLIFSKLHYNHERGKIADSHS